MPLAIPASLNNQQWTTKSTLINLYPNECTQRLI